MGAPAPVSDSPSLTESTPAIVIDMTIATDPSSM